MMRRSLLLSATAIGLAALVGFVAGHSSSQAASSTRPQTASAAISAPAGLPAALTVSSKELKNLNLQTGSTVIAPLTRSVSATGSVGYDQLRLARVSAPASGKIEAVNVVVGDRVSSGQPLAILNNFDLSAARSNVASADAAVSQAKVQLATAQAALARARNLISSGGMSQSELDMRRATVASMQAELNTRQAELRQYQDTEARLMPVSSGGARATPMAQGIAGAGPADTQSAVVAPFQGLVDSVSVSPGDTVTPSVPIFTIADLSTVWVQANVEESDLGAVQVGDKVQVRVSAYPDRVFTGTVADIADQIDPLTGTAKVRCVVPNPDGALRVNMFSNVTIIAPLGRNAIELPSAALQTINGQNVVFIPTGHGQFAWRAVHTGLTGDGETEITSGLAASTPVVTRGSYWLKAILMQTTIPDEG
jgi:membrane fusion protein, heavy metal efflux system